jgi:hypothetical protein
MAPKLGSKRKFTPFIMSTAGDAPGANRGLNLGRSPQDFPLPSLIQNTISVEPYFGMIPTFGQIGFGAIVQTTLYEQWTPSATKFTPDNKSLNEKSIALFRWNEYAIQKQRWCIVLHVYTDSYIVLPIYTNGGNGIRSVPLQHKNNYLRMYDPRAWVTDKPESLTDPSNRDLHVDNHGRAPISQDAWVRATFPVSLSSVFKPVKIVGYLTPISAQKLRNYFDRRPFDRQIMTPTARTTNRTGYEGQRSSGSGRVTRSQGPAEPIEVGPNKRVRTTPGNSRANSSGGQASGPMSFTYNRTAEFTPGMGM